jgi:hypothetical protein
MNTSHLVKYIWIYSIWILLTSMGLGLERQGGLVGLSLWLLFFAGIYGIPFPFLFLLSIYVDALLLHPIGLSFFILCFLLFIRSNFSRYIVGIWTISALLIALSSFIFEHRSLSIGWYGIVPVLTFVFFVLRKNRFRKQESW